MPAFAPSYFDDLQLLRSAAVAAGIIALGFFRQDVKSWTKDNASPVSEADLVVDRFLASTLLGGRPHYGWLSEETVDNPSRLDCDRVFIVDPIDGTRAFLRGEDCWTISLAVVENGAPVAGVVYAPARDEMYEASLGAGPARTALPWCGPAGPARPRSFPLPAPCTRSSSSPASTIRGAPPIPRSPIGWSRWPPAGSTPRLPAGAARIGILPGLPSFSRNRVSTSPMSVLASLNSTNEMCVTGRLRPCRT